MVHATTGSQALVINDEVTRFRTALLIQEQVAATTALAPQGRHRRRGSIHDATKCSAQTSGERVAFDHVTDAGRAIGKDSASMVEARALAVLQRRDRVSECGPTAVLCIGELLLPNYLKPGFSKPT